MANKAFLGIGSNKGDRLEYIRQAVSFIKNDKNCYIIDVSNIYETIPYGVKDQQNFFNAVICIETKLWLKDFFKLIKDIESKVGRNTSKRWGPREIDLDILFFNDFIYEDEEVIIPHPDILNRDFVLIPMIEIDAEIEHPKLLKKLIEINKSELENHILRVLPEKII